MSAGTDTFGDIAELATALGVLDSGGQISSAFFADPTGTMGGTLRDNTRRAALLQFLDDALGGSAPQVQEPSATWTPIFQLNADVHLYLVSTQLDTGTMLGIGVRGSTSGSPHAEGRVTLPIALIPASGPPVFLPGSSNPHAAGELFAEVDVGSPNLQSVGLTAVMPIGTGANGDLSITVTGLRVPGSDAPIDLTLGSDADIGPELLHVVSSLVETELQAAAADIGQEATTFLGLLGLAPDSVVPLPIADIAVRGLAALQEWLAQLADSEDALHAWFSHLAGLLGATVVPNSLTADLSIAAGVDLTVGLAVDTDDTAGRRFAPTFGLTATVDTDAALELEATLFRVSIGAHPSVTALPTLECHARYGPTSGSLFDQTIDGTHLVVGALRAGVGLDETRRPVFVLAADGVTIGSTTHAVLDLTSPDALAEVGGEALATVLGNLVAGLGAPGTAVGELLGLTVPSSWTSGGWPTIDAAALIANPVSAWLAFQREVLALGSQAFADLLSAIPSLLGKPDVANAAGTEADPWVIVGGADLALAAWTTPSGGDTVLHAGVRAAPVAPQIGGSNGPTPSLRASAEILAVTLPANAAPLDLHVLPAASLTAGLTTPVGHPVEVALGPATVDVPGAELALTWSTAGGTHASFDLPGATVTVDSTTTPFALPTVDGDGDLVLPAGLSDEVLERLLAGALAEANAPWLSPLAQALGLGDPSVAGASFAELLSDPRGWIVDRLRAVLSSADPAAADASLHRIADSLAALVGVPGTSPPDTVSELALTAPATISGSGRPDDPLVVPLQAGPSSLRVSVWLDPDGPPIPPGVLSSLLQPSSLTDWLDGSGQALGTADLAQLLGSAAAAIPGLADLIAGRGALAAGWDAFVARCAGGDGLLPGAAPDIAGATTSTLAGIAHPDLSAHLDLTTLAGLPAHDRVLYVTGPYVPPWPDGGIPTLDLTTAGLPDTAFDTSEVASGTGPWHVRLPFRDDCPGSDAPARAQACAARLGRAISAASSGGKTVLLVAHGPAAASIAQLATTGAPVVGLVLLGATSAAVPLDVLDQAPMADALALARRFLPADASDDGPDLASARSVVGVLGDLFDSAHDPTVDLTPPSGLAAPAVPAWSVRGSIDSATLTRSLGALTRAGLAAFEPGTGGPENPGAPAPAPPTALRAAIDVRTPLPSSVSTNDPAGISLDVTARLDLGGFALASGHPAPPPALALEVDVYREGGWLAGGPQGSTPVPGVLRTPSLRRAKLSVGADLTSGTRGGRATLTLFEGSALGVTRDAWVLGTDGDTLGAEARVLLGRLAGALAPVPSSGPVAALADLVAALGLADPATSLPGFGFSVDAVQQLLVDPVNALGGAFAAQPARLAAADALRRLLGATGTGGAVALNLGVVDVGLDLGATPPAVAVSTDGLALGGGPTLSGNARVDVAGVWGGRISFGASGPASFGSPGFELDLESGGAPSASLTFGAAPAGIPDRIPLYPPPASGQLAGIGQAALAAAGGAALRALIAAIRTDVLSAPQRNVLDPVLAGLGLLTDAGVPTPPFGLFDDPVGYLAHALGWSSGDGPAADAVATLVDDARALFGLGAAAHGTLPLPGSVSLTAGPASTGGLRLAVGYSGTESDVTATVDTGITIEEGVAPVPHLDATIGLSGQAARVELSLDGPQLAATLHTAGGDIALLPSGPGLGSLASAAQQALPWVLDALKDHAPDPIPAVLGAVRDVLGLGTGDFDGAQLQQLAANPGAELLRRLVAHGTAAFADLRAILPTLPPPWAVAADASHLRVSFGAQWVELRLAGGPPVLTVETSITADLPGLTGASATIDATLDTNGFRGLTASGQIAPANAIAIGPLSLAPIVEVAVGPAASPPRIEAGLVVSDGSGTRAALLSIDLAPVAVTLRTRTNETDDPTADAGVVVTHVLVPLVANAALQESHVHDLLQTSVGGGTLAGLLHGVLLTTGDQFDTEILALDPNDLMTRLVTLIANVAGATPPLALPENLSLSFNDTSTKRGLRITVAPGERADLIPGGDIALGIEVDDSWVDPSLNGATGLSVMIVETSGTPRFIPPIVEVDGVGLRLYRRSGALLDTELSIGSVGLFGLLKIDASGPGLTDGGLALQLADVAISPASATGGSNGVAQGILGNTAKSGGGGDGTPLKPAFSPELALQLRQGSSDLEWSLTAGPGNGPWLVHIGRSFGPLRVDDVGFGDDLTNHRVTAIRIFISGGLSLAGLNLDVQELSIGAPWPSDGNGSALTDPAAWSLDLAGLDVSYSGGGVQLAGGLRRRDNPSLPGNPPDYVGVLLARVGPYGLTAFGGYGQFPSPGGNFTALFVFAAINAPIGGPPAFFVTGLGGGAGINRALVLPTELNDFASFPMIAALDPNSTMASDPEGAMDLLSSSFPPQQGTYWFAAGLSFTSFTLVEVVAVVAVEVGDGFAITVLGLARAALPNADLALVELELALMAHFSTSEGVFEVLAQLTDNSYLLTRDCRLTGGFAYASWFSPNPNAGQFVLSVGGYHPSFHHDGYPVVPRVGFRWDLLGCLTITGESYFALTSDAIMAGTSFTAALTLGPLWASMSLGVDAIIYFDPFHFLASGYASIAAGITIDIDLFFGSITVTLSFHLGATVTVSGPSFHGSATIDLDVTSATISFGDTNDPLPPPLGWDAFSQKYLTAGGAKPVLTAAMQGGAITPGAGAPTPDGTDANPWLFVPEFSLAVASTAAANHASATVGVTDAVPLNGGWVDADFALDGTLAIAPMAQGAIGSRLGVSIVSADDTTLDAPVFGAAPGIAIALVSAPMPKAVWAPQLPSGAIPSGDTITAGTGLVITVTAEISPGSPQIDYSQVQPGARQPLPFAAEALTRPSLDADDANAADFASTSDVSDALQALDEARTYLNSAQLDRPMTLLGNATFRRDHVSPPRLALITEGIAPPDVAPPDLTTIVPPSRPPVDTTVLPPVVTAFLAGGTVAQQRPVTRTTAVQILEQLGARRDAAQGDGSIPRVAAPTLASVTAGLDPALGARLQRTPPLPQALVPPAGDGGLLASDGGPVTRRASAPGEVHALPGLDASSASLLEAHQTAIMKDGTTLRPGDVLVTTLPNHERDMDDAAPRPALSFAGDAALRVVALSAVGEVLADQTASQASVEVPQHTARLVAWCVGGSGDTDPAQGASTASGLAGWSGTDRLPYVGAGVTLGRDCVITGLAAPRRGHRDAQAGHHQVASPAAAAPVIRTLLPAGTSVAVVSLDTDEAPDLAGLTVGIDGATRATDASGAPTPPVVVSARGRVHLLYDLTAGAPGETPSRVGVTVGTSSSWRVVGVMGGTGTSASTSDLLAAGGAADLLAAVLHGPTGSAQLRWSVPVPAPAGPGGPGGVSLPDLTGAPKEAS